ncbi:MAG: M23 family metallopeptidase [Propionibacteriaceae bacterium]|nr:M23 family metallopeptidase [Propionibacteriaceae bacterium]
MRADKPRRAVADPTPRPAIRLSKQLRHGIALAIASGLAMTAIGAFGLSNYPTTVLAFANQSSPAAADIEQARADDTSRSAERVAPTFEDLVKQRARAIAQTGEQVEAQRYSDAAAKRNSLLKKAAASVEDEAERLRNLENFLWPTEGGVGSPWGMRLHPILRYYRLHGGADIGGRCGQPIYAAQSGTVTKAANGGYNGGSGNNVRIDHGDINGVHVETAYLHMSKIVVKDGQKVDKGDLIGNVGNTGLSTACHLHLSLYKNGENSDPLEYVKKPAKQDKQEAKGDENSADYELGEEGAPADAVPA